MSKELNEAKAAMITAGVEFTASQYAAAEADYKAAITNYLKVIATLEGMVGGAIKPAILTEMQNAYANLSVCFEKQSKFTEAVTALTDAKTHGVNEVTVAGVRETFDARIKNIYELYGSHLLAAGGKQSLDTLLTEAHIDDPSIITMAHKKLLELAGTNDEKIVVLDAAVGDTRVTNDAYKTWFKQLCAIEHLIKGAADAGMIGGTEKALRDHALAEVAKGGADERGGVQMLVKLWELGDEGSQSPLFTIAHDHNHDDVAARILCGTHVTVDAILA